MKKFSRFYPRAVRTCRVAELLERRPAEKPRKPKKLSPLAARALAELLAAEGKGMHQWELVRAVAGTHNCQWEGTLNALWERKFIEFLLDDYVELTPQGVEHARGLKGGKKR